MKKALFKLQSGAVLDQKYRIDDIIGSGGMGYVYRATNIVLKRQVAIKTLQKQKGADDTALLRFQQEAQIAASVGHDNICEVIDFGIDRPKDSEFDVYYLVMPLLSGKSLGQWFDSWVKPSPSVFVDVIAQTLLGLHAAHTKKIVHRDLKPDNIYITNIGDRDNFVKILDFGISKYLESDTALDLTKTGIAMGTPLYMSPEQAKGAKHIDLTADIYSVGVVLYEGFVGQLPYQGDNFNDVLLKIASKPFPKPRQVNPDVPVEIEKVILKAMSRAPVDRYENTVLMRQALLKAASKANIDSRKSFIYPPTQIKSRTEKKTVDVNAAATPISENVRVQSKLQYMTRKSASSKPSEQVEMQRKEGRRMLQALIGIIVLSLIAAIAGIAYIALRNNNPATETTANVVPAVPQSEKSATTDETPKTSIPEAPQLTMPLTIPNPEPAAEDDTTTETDATQKTTKRRKTKHSSASIDTDPATMKVLSRPSQRPKKRTIERNVDDIFD